MQSKIDIKNDHGNGALMSWNDVDAGVFYNTTWGDGSVGIVLSDYQGEKTLVTIDPENLLVISDDLIKSNDELRPTTPFSGAIKITPPDL